MPLAVAAAGLVVTAIVGAGAWRQTLQERDRAVAAEGETARALGVADKHLTDALETQALSAEREERRPTAEVLAAHALSRRESPDLRGLLAAQIGGRPQRLGSRVLPDCVRHVLAPDGERLLCIGPTSSELLGADGAVRWRIEGQLGPAVFAGERVAVMRDGLRLEVREVATGEIAFEVPDMPGPSGLRSNGRLVAQGNGLLVAVVDTETGRVDRSAQCVHAITTVALGPGDELAVLCARGDIWVGPALGSRRHLPSPFPNDRATAGLVTFAGSGTLLLGSPQGLAAVVDLGDDTGPPAVRVSDEELRALLPLPDAERVAVLDASGRARLVNLRTGALRSHLPGPITGLRALPDGEALLTLDGRDAVRWRLPAEPQARAIRVPVGLSNAAISPDRRWLVAGSGDGVLRVYATDDGSLAAAVPIGDGVIKQASFSPDGGRIVTASVALAAVHQLRVGTWEALDSPPAAPMRRAGALADGSLWALNWGHSVWTLRRGEDSWHTEDVGTSLHDGASSADGRRAAFVDGQGGVWRLETADDAPLRRLFERPGAIAVALDATGDRVLLSEHDGLRLFDSDRALLRFIPVPGPAVGDVALSPDDRWVAGAQSDGTVRVWELASGREAAVLRGHEGRASSVAFDSSGAELVTAGWGGQILRWSVPAFDRSPAELLAEVEAAWGLALEDAL